MDLAFGTAGNQQVAVCGLGLPDTFDLEGLAERIAANPSAVAAAYGVGPMIRHFTEIFRVQSINQFSGQFRTIFKAAEPTRVLKCQFSVQRLKANSTLVDFIFKKIVDVGDLEIQINPCSG